MSIIYSSRGNFCQVRKKRKILRRDILLGARRISNYIFGRTLVAFGVAMIAYFGWRENPIRIQNQSYSAIRYFYGSLAIISGLFILLTTSFYVGIGFDEYNNEKEELSFFRLGFPGPKRLCKSIFRFSELSSIYLENRVFLIDFSISNLYLITTTKRKFPLIQINKETIYSYRDVERFAVRLSQFLKLPIEGF